MIHLHHLNCWIVVAFNAVHRGSCIGCRTSTQMQVSSIAPLPIPYHFPSAHCCSIDDLFVCVERKRIASSFTSAPHGRHVINQARLQRPRRLVPLHTAHQHAIYWTVVVLIFLDIRTGWAWTSRPAVEDAAAQCQHQLSVGETSQAAALLINNLSYKD